jgi:hypothetical protein
MTRATLTAKMAVMLAQCHTILLLGSRLFFCFDHSATDGKVLKSYCWIFNVGF